ncbi:VOC family protein [Actinomyces capricornis]|uniref:Glyoxalase/bleomycin resistance protein n=1 Tax=Actinomyces capricornis TaxID=2755559 RepID=A0ABN6K437_9ACTO|nr:VOC family protein [Actinomyces capricornis]BDA64399.1 putative glyoxalase/bleomycin resistance protein [Actinomyces capricornis]
MAASTVTTTTSPGRPCWLELYTPDAEAAAAFYGGLLGWQVADADPGSGISTMVLLRDHLIASFEPQEGQQDDGGWLVTLLVDDVAAAVTQAEAAGGGVVIPCTEVGEDGTTTFAVVTDPGGAQVGMISDTDPAPAAPQEAGMPLWYEVLTDGLDAGVGFYETVFGWRTREVEPGQGLPYRVNDPGTGPLCGIGERSAFTGGAPAWRVYFGVEDLDSAAARVPALGGRALGEPQDSPYGRILPVADPHGANFMLVEM